MTNPFFISFVVIVLLYCLFFHLGFFYYFNLLLLIFQFMTLTFITDSILIFFIALDKIIDSGLLIIIYFFNIPSWHTLWTVCLFLRFQEFSLSSRIYLHIYLSGKSWLCCRSNLVVLINHRLWCVVRLKFILIYLLKVVARTYLAKLLSFTIKVALLQSLLAVASWHYLIELTLYFLLVEGLLLNIF